MDTKLAPVAYVLPGLAVVFGIPMALGIVPPNRFYGYRTRKTLSSEDVWNRANGVSGWSMIVAEILALGCNALFQESHADWPSATQQLFVSLSTALLLFVGPGFSPFFVRKLQTVAKSDAQLQLASRSAMERKREGF